MLKIGDKLELKSGIILSPMAGITDLPFRALCRRFGCELAFVEMINCRSLSYKSRRTQQMLSTVSTDRPLGVQLLGCEPKFILRALEVLSKFKFDLLDFNAACPAKKVVRRQEGASLLRQPEKLQGLLRLIVKNTPVPVTVKMRIGWDDNSLNIKDTALLAQDAGVAAIFIHGRTKFQGYSGRVDYQALREAKQAVTIPVIASGDIFSASLAKRMLEETGADAIAVARGALGNPWIFPQIEGYLKNGLLLEKPSFEEILEIMLFHLSLCVDFYGERRAIVVFRKFFIWYTKGLRKIRPLREKVSGIRTIAAMLELLEKLRTTREVKPSFPTP